MNMIRKAEKDGEQIEDLSGQYANLPYKPLPTKMTTGLMTATSKQTNRNPSISSTNPEAIGFPKEGNTGEINTLVTFNKNKKDPFKWISTRQTGDDEVLTKDAPYHKAWLRNPSRVVLPIVKGRRGPAKGKKKKVRKKPT
ncbi:hypothetical protein E2C01_055035 [Portunus trituberculatus]|uniref:Uncharacterized protein n=1 Tax=Portunus trituberculatus TaxID=210409 RepID=A0A5B7GTM0_PORTR|nr:hypothetical protein [Portunus trituberculatus]